MVQPSPVQSQRPVSISTTQGFLSLIKYWLGRLISISIHLPSNLYALICRTQSAASPIMNHSGNKDDSPSLSRKKGTWHSTFSPTNQKIPSPLKEKDSIQDDVFEEEGEDNLQPIVNSLFQNMGLSENPKEALAVAASILDDQSKKSKNTDLSSLNGQYQIIWDIQKDNDFFKFGYLGNLKNGLFHREGTFFTESLDGICHILLDGLFVHGRFTSGTMTMNDSYIDGIFINGKMQGAGTIHYFKEIQNAFGQPIHLEYRGDFSQARPHGKGKMLGVESEVKLTGSQLLGGLQLFEMGIFKSGLLVKGLSQQENNTIFEGEWQGDTFTGRSTNLKEKWEYKGKHLQGVFEGPGTLTTEENYEYEILEPLSRSDENGEEPSQGAIPLVQKTGTVKCTYEGQFHKGSLFEGEQIVKWIDHEDPDNEKDGIFYFEKGKIIKQEITTPKGLKYVGTFHSYTLDGEGTLYNEEGKELYTGGLKCGFPHGKGCLKEEQNQEGTFLWGNFKGSDDFEIDEEISEVK